MTRRLTMAKKLFNGFKKLNKNSYLHNFRPQPAPRRERCPQPPAALRLRPGAQTSNLGQLSFTVAHRTTFQKCFFYCIFIILLTFFFLALQSFENKLLDKCSEFWEELVAVSYKGSFKYQLTLRLGGGGLVQSIS